MIFGLEPTEMIEKFPEKDTYKYIKELPKWGKPLVEFVGPRMMLEADQIVLNMFGSGNRKGRKKLYELSRLDFLSRFELYYPGSEVPIIAYTLGLRGMRETGYLRPTGLTVVRAQEYIAANEFIFFNSEVIDDFQFYREKQTLIGEVHIEDVKAALWTPRIRVKDSKIRSLLVELAGYDALITVAPDFKHVRRIARELVDLGIPIGMYFVTDKKLRDFWMLEDGVLIPVEEAAD